MICLLAASAVSRPGIQHVERIVPARWRLRSSGSALAFASAGVIFDIGSLPRRRVSNVRLSVMFSRHMARIATSLPFPTCVPH
jgi:hypothetical protein